MVKLSLSVVAMAATLASLVAAAPCREDMAIFRSFKTSVSCIEGAPAELEPFKLQDRYSEMKLSKLANFNLVFGGAMEKIFTEIEFCVVTNDNQVCGTGAGCMEGGLGYRFRVHEPFEGYLRANPDSSVSIVDNYHESSIFKMYQRLDNTVFIEDPDGRVISTNGAGAPIKMENYITNEDRQKFNFV